MPGLKYVLFDFDGTLVNSEQFHFECWNRTLKAYQIVLSQEAYNDHLMGVPNYGNAQYLIRAYDLPTTIDELVRVHEIEIENSFRHANIEFMPFALEILQWLTFRDVRLGLVTGSSRQDVEWVFEQLDLHKYFEVTITCNDVQYGKPHPESYNRGFQFFTTHPEECIALEDSPGGVASAKSSGLTCFGVQSHESLRQKLLKADQIFDDLEAVKNFLEQEGLV